MYAGLRAATLAAGLGAAGCVVYDSGPTAAGGYPYVEGRWTVDAWVISSTCGFVSDERFSAYAIQNRDLIQLSIDVSGFGEVRYDGRVDRNGDFFVRQTTVFPRSAIRDESEVDGRFGPTGRSLSATEVEWITDLVTGDSCRVTWEWEGDRF